MAEQEQSTTSNDFDVEDYQLTGTIAMLVAVTVLGSLGNIAVLIVYGRKKDERTATFFIIVLSAVDLIVCVVVVPFTLAMEIHAYRFSYNFICKSYYILNIANPLYSSLLISAVAVDRYLCICHPLHRIMTVKRAKILVSSLAIFAIINGILGAMNIQVEEKTKLVNVTEVTPLGNITQEQEVFNYYMCEETPSVANVSDAKVIFYQIVQKTNLISFVCCIFFVIVLYSMVFRVVLNVRKKNKTLLVKVQAPPPPATIMHIGENGEPEPLIIEKRRNTHDQKPRKSFISQNMRRVSMKVIRDSDLFQNFRSATILFVVAVVYILCFCPSLLVITQAVDFNLILYCLYYVNNASNPIIYCFMNSGFRRELKKLFFNQFMPKRLSHYSDGNTDW